MRDPKQEEAANPQLPFALRLYDLRQQWGQSLLAVAPLPHAAPRRPIASCPHPLPTPYLALVQRPPLTAVGSLQHPGALGSGCSNGIRGVGVSQGGRCAMGSSMGSGRWVAPLWLWARCVLPVGYGAEEQRSPDAELPPGRAVGRAEGLRVWG